MEGYCMLYVDYFTDDPLHDASWIAPAWQGFLRMLAYGAHGDSGYDYLRMAESTTLDCFYRFRMAMIAVIRDIYLRSPTIEHTAKILAVNKARGFPRMLGSIDCMHWKLKNCLFAWQNNKGYYHANGIYPKWATFVKTIYGPDLLKEKEFVKEHVAERMLSVHLVSCIRDLL
ncbi:uncharacterized protein [Lolium perenne]|uniref:uncharacterized protein n=1 Tax=Lolium perenne TaxID=4522 RepID=UPI0021F620F9|nr:uncharacterized protein LOC127348111 [Lolium perenne]